MSIAQLIRAASDQLLVSVGPEFKQILNGAANDQFGYSVAIDGDTAAVGAVNTDTFYVGAALIYVRADSNSSWTLQQTLQAPTKVNNEYFGSAVAVRGNTLAVAAYASSRFSSQAGAVYIYTRSGSTWTYQSVLGSGSAANDQFGFSLAMTGTTLAVGVPMSSTAATNAGKVCLYDLATPMSPTLMQVITPASSMYAKAGTSVALDGSLLAIGIPQTKIGPTNYFGSVVVYYKSGASFSIEQTVIVSDTDLAYRYGQQIALYNNTLAIGPGSIPPSYTGKVHLWTRSGTTWSQQAILVPTVTLANSIAWQVTNSTIALGQDSLAVGLPGEPGTTTNAGAAVLYKRTGTAWNSGTYINSSRVVQYARLGNAVAIGGDTALLAAYMDYTGGTGTGSVQTFKLT